MALIDGVWLSPAMLPALCELTGTHRTTAMRWYRRRQLPAAVRRLVAIAWHGRLEEIHDAWRGFAVDHKTGHLVTPGGWAIAPCELLALPLRYQELSALRAQLRELAVMPHQLALYPAYVRAHRAPRARERGRAGHHGHDDRQPDGIHVTGAGASRAPSPRARPGQNGSLS